jgi:site-specific recombinase XerC
MIAHPARARHLGTLPASRGGATAGSWITAVIHQIPCDHCPITPAPPRFGEGQLRYPEWFFAFLGDRATRKPSPHTIKACKQDFTATATLLAGAPECVVHLTPDAIAKDSMQTAFAAYAHTHEAASIRRCWSNWNTLCDFLYSGELITGNPMPLIGRPKVAKTLPKGLGN